MIPHRGPTVDQTSLTIVLPLTLAAFFVAFACWTLFAVIGVDLQRIFQLSNTRYALLIAMPVLAGGLLSFPLGLMTQRFGGRRVILACLVGLVVALALLSWVTSYTGFLLAGAGLGMAGGLFSAGLHYLVSYLPPGRAGLVFGVFGVGLGGAGFSYLIVPAVREAYSWELAPLAYLLVIVLIILLLLVLTDPEPRPSQSPQPSRSDATAQLWITPMACRFSLYFGFLFGGVVALMLWLPGYLSAVFSLSLDDGARWSLLFALPMVLSQVPGGMGADRFGSVLVLRIALFSALVLLFLLSYPDTTMTIHGVTRDIPLHLAPSLSVSVVLLVLLSAAMGTGIGAVMRLLFEQFPKHLGGVGGMMLASGCISAFALPMMFGMANDLVGIRSSVFMLLFALCGMTVLTLESAHYRHYRPLDRAL
ncbi:MFS transporter [Marinobacter mobilis]|uniref:MFS transporter, NNP family, nitrate/nitrite transporter n=1 Tax=Marinobacter mobilis TaxID=488533 RepID=A0A1H2R6Z5_9GAMM|nr:MFS transporter [Marinobacter mobilis]SDW15095.1 MFS transporter, NNP family, nitrate/nitrite transporter [Marinobacter mobilis]